MFDQTTTLYSQEEIIKTISDENSKENYLEI